jgi:hypothetical protein
MYEPVLSATIVGSVDGALVNATPAFLESIRLTTFTRESLQLSYLTCSRQQGPSYRLRPHIPQFVSGEIYFHVDNI